MDRGLSMPRGPSQRLAGSRVLVVDDDEAIRAYLLAVFADEGAAICEAADGVEALEAAVHHRPDVITLDLSMPGRDGIEVFTDLRTNPATEHIPVCIVSGHPEFRQLIFERPVEPPEGFVTKPFDPEELLRTLRRILALGARRRARQHEPGRD